MSKNIDYEEIKEDAINRVYLLWGEEKADIIRRSPYAWLVDELTKSAMEYAEEVSLNFDEYYELLDNTFYVAEGLRYSLSPENQDLDALVISDGRESVSDSDVETYHDIFRDEYCTLTVEIESRYPTPSLTWHMIDEYAYSYLNLPFRSSAVDRWLVQALMALNLMTEGRAILILDQIFNDPPITPLKTKHPVRNFFLNGFLAAIPLLGGAGLSIYAGSKQWISDGWSIGIATILVVIFMALAVWGLISLPSKWRRHSSGRRRACQHLEAMTFAYKELSSSFAQISSPHIIKVLEKTQDKGVSWNPMVYVLLDDISKRSGTF